MAIVLGIDPGLNGALCLYGDGVFQVHDMPVYAMTVNKKTRNRVDMLALADLIDSFSVIGVDLAVMEAVGGRPKQSASAAFVFGYSVGLIAMGLMNARIPIETVTPQVWKKIMKMPGKVAKPAAAKKASEAQIKARGHELFPQHRTAFEGLRGGVKLDRIEAAALAAFGHRHVLGSQRPDGEWRLTYQKADTGG